MLLLSRKPGQKISILDGEIVLTVVEILGDRVRLGFEADQRIRINRQEVQQRIDAGIRHAKDVEAEA